MTATDVKRTRAIVIAAVSLTLLVGGVFVRQWTLLTAQRNHESMLVVIDACKKHLHEHQGNWPSSWEELEPFLGSMEIRDARRAIAIDFAAHPANLAFEHDSNFSGVRPKFQSDRTYKEELSELIDVLRHYHPPEMTEPSVESMPSSAIEDFLIQMTCCDEVVGLA